MSRSTLVLAAALLALGVGCGKGEPDGNTERMTVRGTVSQLSVAQGARAVAVGADGRTVWATLDGHGDFSLRLPLGQSYRIVIANPRRAAGHLVLARGATSTRWIAARSTTTIDLGRLSPAATTTTAATGGIRTQSTGAGELEGAESEDASEHEDDAESHEGSENEVCSGGASDVELRASSEPGEDAKDDAEHDDHDDDCGEHESENEAEDD